MSEVSEAKKKLKKMREDRRQWVGLKLAAKELRKAGHSDSAAHCDALAAELLKRGKA